jgi:hypothetical protein
MFVGNNWEGTADIIDARRFRRLARINIVPDREERMREIMSDPERQAFFLAIREFVGEGNDQFVDDMFTSHDGRFVYVSRPSFADVVGISLRTQPACPSRPTRATTCLPTSGCCGRTSAATAASPPGSWC